MSIFKEVGLCRYEWTAYRNVSLTCSFTVLPGVLMELGMPTYTQLINRVERETLAVQNSQQQFANLMTTLNSFLACSGKTHNSPVGPELGRMFEETCRRYCESLGLSERTIRDRRSHLNKWRKAAEVLLSEGRAQGGSPLATSSDFHELLRTAVAKTGRSIKSLAREVEMSFTTLGRWLRGTVPNAKGRPAVARLEAACGLKRGQLSDSLKELRQPHDSTHRGTDPIQYREELGARLKNQYYLPVRDFSPLLLAELQALYVYKTVKRPALERSSRGQWSTHPASQRPDQPELPFNPEVVCVGYGMFTSLLSSYLGYICLAASKGGFGRSRQEAQTLAWLAVPDAVEGYMEYLKRRSNGLTHGWHARFSSQIKMLVHPTTGYLTQQSSFAERLPADMQGHDWTAMCAEARATAVAWAKDAKDISRNPADPIAGLLALDEPLEPVIQAVRELDKSALAAPEGSLDEAVHKRDALLLSMLLVNPLRLRNYVSMSIWASRAGYIYLSGSRYRIAIPKGAFKNSRSQGVQDYDVGVPEFLTARIEEYLEVYRPILIGNNKDLGMLFPSSKTGGVYRALGRHVHKITKRLIPGCPGTGMHGFRHLVATVWLTKNPGDFLTVAELLNDRLATVMKHYAHLSKDDSLARHALQVAGLFGIRND